MSERVSEGEMGWSLSSYNMSTKCWTTIRAVDTFLTQGRNNFETLGPSPTIN